MMTLFERCKHPLYLVALLVPLSGCARWDSEKWNLDQLRDERAVDIDQRLSTREPIVKNPF
jgi:hypothetical protein